MLGEGGSGVEQWQRQQLRKQLQLHGRQQLGLLFPESFHGVQQDAGGRHRQADVRLELYQQGVPALLRWPVSITVQAERRQQMLVE